MMDKTNINRYILAVVSMVILNAQSPDTLWSRTYGGPGDDLAAAIRICADSGYIICGTTTSYGSGGRDVYLVRTDDKGDTMWTRAYGGPQDDEGRDVELTPDGGFLAVGYTASFGAGGRDVYVVRVDALGDTLWTRTYGGSSDDEANSIQPTPDGGFLACGTTYSFGAGVGDVYLLKLGLLSDTLWSRTYGGTSTDEGADVAVLQDSTLVLCGSTWSYGAGAEDVYLIKTDPKGDTVWNRTHGGTEVEMGFDLAVTSDGGFIVSGTSFFSILGYDLFVFKTDGSGHVQWNYFNGSLGDDHAYTAAEIPDRGYVIAGNFSYEIFLIRTDTAGNNYQQWIFGGAGTDWAKDVAVHADRSYALLGNTTSFGQGMTDIWLIKIAQDTLGAGEMKESSDATPFLMIAPNPCRTRLTLRFTMPDSRSAIKNIALKIYDSSGRIVKDISDGLRSCIMDHASTLCWNTTDDAGHPLPPGVYFIVLDNGGQLAREKVVLTR